MRRKEKEWVWGGERNKEVSVLGDKAGSLKHSEKLFVIFTMVFWSPFQGNFRWGWDLKGSLCFLIWAFAHFLQALAQLPFSPKKSPLILLAQRNLTVLGCKAVTVTLVIIFNGKILLNWLPTHRGVFGPHLPQRARPDMVAWHHRSWQRSVAWNSFVFFPEPYNERWVWCKPFSAGSDYKRQLPQTFFYKPYHLDAAVPVCNLWNQTRKELYILMLEIRNYFSVKDFPCVFFSFHLMKSFPVFALREIKHIQLNYATYRQKQSKREPLCWLNFTVAIGNRDKFGKLRNQVWGSALCLEGKAFPGTVLSFLPSLHACCLCPVRLCK